LDVVK
jgi:hypothetical protein